MAKTKTYSKRVRLLTDQIMVRWECDLVQALIVRRIDFEILKN